MIPDCECQMKNAELAPILLKLTMSTGVFQRFVSKFVQKMQQTMRILSSRVATPEKRSRRLNRFRGLTENTRSNLRGQYGRCRLRP